MVMSVLAAHSSITPESINQSLCGPLSALPSPLMFMDKHQSIALERLKATFHGALKNYFIFECLSTILKMNAGENSIYSDRLRQMPFKANTLAHSSFLYPH